MLGDFDGCPSEFAVALGFIGVIAGRADVEVVAIKVGRVVDEKIADAVDHSAIRDGWKTEAGAAHRNRYARHYDGTSFCSSIAGQHNGDLVPEADQRFWQRFDHVCEAAGF